MENNILTKVYRSVKSFLIYQPPNEPPPFILDETGEDKGTPLAKKDFNPLVYDKQELDKLLTYAYQLEAALTKARDMLAKKISTDELSNLAEEVKVLDERKAELAPIVMYYDAALRPIDRQVSTSLKENKKIVDDLFHADVNQDILTRQFEIPAGRPIKAMLIFLDGMIDREIIDLAILQPLMNLTDISHTVPLEQLVTVVVEKYLPSNEAKRVKSFEDIANSVNGGDTVLFVDGIDEAIVLGTKGYKQRGVERPQIEQSVRGSQVAFSEGLRTNTGLMHTFLPTTDLVTEIIMIGDRIPQKAAVMYLKSLANPALVTEIKRRLNGISVDYALNLGTIEQLIEDFPKIPFPQSLSTERPDRAAFHLTEGRVILLYEGVPFAYLLPVTFFTFFHSIEDHTLKWPLGTFMRILRLGGALISVILPSMYLAINYFHQEALPTELALAVAGAREKVPFPALIEVLLMEFAFELIREAGLRVPGILGSTIGIVGAIILGQAAVSANLVSPIMVVVIAMTGLASFTIPDYHMAMGLRIMRFVFLLLSSFMGLVGLSFGLLYLTVLLCSVKSYGVPYMAPLAPKTIAGLDIVVSGMSYRQERRPDELNSQDDWRQPHISRRWRLGKPTGKE